MADTGIIQRRDVKANLWSQPPIEGEIVFATDTQEYGALVNGVLIWRPHKNDITKALADEWYQPKDEHIVSDEFYVHTDNNYTTNEKAKLAGIEVNATQDQTKADIDFLEIDAGTLDDLDSTQFLRSDVDDTFDANLVVTGNLTVQGTTTTVQSETIQLADNIITLNFGATGVPSENAGLEVERGDSLNVELRWNELNDEWEYTKDGTNFYTIIDRNDETNLEVFTARQWKTARTLQLSGDVSGSISINGANDVNMGVSVGNDTHSHSITTLTDFLENVQDILGSDLIGGTYIDVTYDDIGTGKTTITHGDTSSQASINNLASTVIQDITLDAAGHITNINSHEIVASEIAYTNTTSGLTATKVETALDEIDGNLDDVISGTTNITFNNTTSGMAATTVKGAIDEVDSRLDTIEAVNYFDRADKILAGLNIANMIYTTGDLTKIRYTADTDTDYEVLGYTDGNLVSIAHYLATILEGTTILSYTTGSLTSVVYTGSGE